jgi:hypothetical protein
MLKSAIPISHPNMVPFAEISDETFVAIQYGFVWPAQLWLDVQKSLYDHCQACVVQSARLYRPKFTRLFGFQYDGPKITDCFQIVATARDELRLVDCWFPPNRLKAVAKSIAVERHMGKKAITPSLAP